jgi:hypothetical protein
MALLDCLCLLVCVAGYCVLSLISETSTATVLPLEKLATSPYIPTEWLLAFRALIALSIWNVCGRLLLDKEGLTLDIAKRDKSNLRVHLKHGERFAPFTVWCWTLQGLYFTMATYGSASHLGLLSSSSTSPALTSVACILFELSFSVAFLVSAVVSFVLMPATVSRGLPLDNFFKPWPLIMHNANVVFVASEMVLNRLTFDSNHHPWVLLYAATYVLFAWGWFSSRGYFFYFFLDYAAPLAPLWYLALLVLLLACFFGGLVVSQYVEQGSAVAMALLAATTFVVQRVRK